MNDKIKDTTAIASPGGDPVDIAVRSAQDVGTDHRAGTSRAG